MKSLVEEASTIQKAVEKAWIRAGKPAEFTVKIFEEPKHNFLGMTTKSAKVAIFFKAPSQPLSSGSVEKKEYSTQAHSRDSERLNSSRGSNGRGQAPSKEGQGNYSSKENTGHNRFGERTERDRSERNARPSRHANAEHTPSSRNNDSHRRSASASHRHDEESREIKNYAEQRRGAGPIPSRGYESQGQETGADRATQVSRSNQQPRNESSRPQRTSPDYSQSAEHRGSSEIRQQPGQRSENDMRAGYDDRPQERSNRRPDTRRGRSDERVDAVWSNEMADIAQDWLENMLTMLDKREALKDVKVVGENLKFDFKQPIIDDKEKEKNLFSAWSHLMLATVGNKYKKDLRGLRIVLSNEE